MLKHTGLLPLRGEGLTKRVILATTVSEARVRQGAQYSRRYHGDATTPDELGRLRLFQHSGNSPGVYAEACDNTGSTGP